MSTSLELDPVTLVIAAVGCIGFIGIHKFINDKFLLMCVPKSCRHKIYELKQKDPALEKLCRSNGTAFLHAAVIIPLLFYCMFFDDVILNDPWFGRSWLFCITGWFMMSYFTWDVCICAIRYRIYGFTFFLHALLTWIGLVFMLSVIKDPSRAPADLLLRPPSFARFCLVFMATEISTPFLHIRFMLIKAKETDTLLFKIINNLFLWTFAGYRLCLVHIFGFYPYVKDMLFDRMYLSYVPITFSVVSLGIIVVWTLLNTYWAILLIHSQLKHLPASFGVSKKQLSSKKTH